MGREGGRAAFPDVGTADTAGAPALAAVALTAPKSEVAAAGWKGGTVTVAAALVVASCEERGCGGGGGDMDMDIEEGEW